jgi:hypothetical protein
LMNELDSECEATTVDRSMATGFSAPSEASGPTVLYLRKVGRWTVQAWVVEQVEAATE